MLIKWYWTQNGKSIIDIIFKLCKVTTIKYFDCIRWGPKVTDSEELLIPILHIYMLRYNYHLAKPTNFFTVYVRRKSEKEGIDWDIRDIARKGKYLLSLRIVEKTLRCQMLFKISSKNSTSTITKSVKLCH